MPTINLPAGSSTQLEPRPAHQHHLPSFAVHAYLGIAVTLVIVIVWCSKHQRRSSPSSLASCGSQPAIKETKASLGCVKLVRPELTGGSHSKEFSQDLVLATPSSIDKLSHLFSSAYTKVPRSSGRIQAMASHEESHLSDRSDPEATASRGVSKKPRSSSRSEYTANLRPQASFSVSKIGRSTPDPLQKHMPPPKTSTNTEGTDSPGLMKGEEGRGTERLQTQHCQIDGLGLSPVESLSYIDAQRQDNGLRGASVAEPRLHFTIPPPPPPMTPPTLDNTASEYQDRRPTSAASVPPALDESFILQPNANYIGHTSSVDISSSIPAQATTITPQISYTKSVPVSIPISNSNFSSSSGHTVPCFPAFSPPSHPPPPVSPDYQFVGGHMGHRTSIDNQHQNESEVGGGIISVFDDDGHSWKRHTQVYGGGVCLTCLGTEGGFYGPNVPLEDRRY